MVGDILQPTHLLFVLVVALLVLGPKRLPEVARQLGNGLRDFRSAISGEDRDEDHGEQPALAEDHDADPALADEPAAAHHDADEPAPAHHDAGEPAPAHQDAGEPAAAHEDAEEHPAPAHQPDPESPAAPEPAATTVSSEPATRTDRTV
ncbi:MAG TPA: twin-arginine translocase TatA/TatE family subunit [Solirubrobacteraceae bacterium]|jgi:TatA/E family protein of Tat protein translocase